MSKKSIRVIPKKRGRPPLAVKKKRDPLVALRLPPEMITTLDDWVELHGLESRSEAIRVLIEHRALVERELKGRQ